MREKKNLQKPPKLLCESCGERCEKCKSLESKLRKKNKECEALISQIKGYHKTLEEAKEEPEDKQTATPDGGTDDESDANESCEESLILVEDEDYNEDESEEQKVENTAEKLKINHANLEINATTPTN